MPKSKMYTGYLSGKTRTATIQLEVEVEFDEYAKNKFNIKANKVIQEWLKDTLLNEGNVPLYLFTDDNGSSIEEIATITKVKVVYAI